MQLSSVSSQMKGRVWLEHERVAEAAHSHSVTVEGSHGNSPCFNLEISLSAPQGSVLPAAAAARTFFLYLLSKAFEIQALIESPLNSTQH